MKNAEANATAYQAADLITISQNNPEVENIASIKSEVETGTQRKRVKNTSIRGKIVTYHSISISANHFANMRP